MKRSFITPDSSLKECPLCKIALHVQPTSVFGDFECPHCEKSLWFLAAGDSPRFFDHQQSTPLREFVIHFIADKLELDRDALAKDPKLLNSKDTDSLERLEMLMELEEELELV